MKLLPCAFCGGSAEFKITRPNSSPVYGYVRCKTKKCRGRAPYGDYPIERSTQDWNTRADKDHYLQMAVEVVKSQFAPKYEDASLVVTISEDKIIDALEQRFSEE